MTPSEAAIWMLEELKRVKYLDQEIVVHELMRQDKTLIYDNASGAPAICKKVLAAFAKIAPTTDYVWSRSGHHWRKRETYDVPNVRMQD